MTRLFRQALDGVIANAKPEHRDHRYDFLCGLCVFFRDEIVLRNQAGIITSAAYGFRN